MMTFPEWEPIHALSLFLQSLATGAFKVLLSLFIVLQLRHLYLLETARDTLETSRDSLETVTDSKGLSGDFQRLF